MFVLFRDERKRKRNELVGEISSSSNLSEESVVGIVESVRGREQVRVCSRRTSQEMAGAEWVRRNEKNNGEGRNVPDAEVTVAEGTSPA